MMGTLAILGTPPFGVFASEFLILTTAMKQQALGDAHLCCWRSAWRLPRFSAVCNRWFLETRRRNGCRTRRRSYRCFAHLGLVLMLGFFIPPYLADWYRAAARLIGGQ